MKDIEEFLFTIKPTEEQQERHWRRVFEFSQHILDCFHWWDTTAGFDEATHELWLTRMVLEWKLRPELTERQLACRAFAHVWRIDDHQEDWGLPGPLMEEWIVD
jgi:hypothetical protein